MAESGWAHGSGVRENGGFVAQRSRPDIEPGTAFRHGSRALPAPARKRQSSLSESGRHSPSWVSGWAQVCRAYRRAAPVALPTLLLVRRACKRPAMIFTLVEIGIAQKKSPPAMRAFHSRTD